jgi:hypothetical protein
MNSEFVEEAGVTEARIAFEFVRSEMVLLDLIRSHLRQVDLLCLCLCLFFVLTSAVPKLATKPKLLARVEESVKQQAAHETAVKQQSARETSRARLLARAASARDQVSSMSLCCKGVVWLHQSQSCIRDLTITSSPATGGRQGLLLLVLSSRSCALCCFSPTMHHAKAVPFDVL